ncbi:DNA translocase FtsK 4TM domain-containing protein [Flavihumibacter sp. ZG627]|uniref:FtsK/SpoIIIE family DNA translocase n=1 Tax=Flavihumibacter sp. ZG627 TaxID=1463156 RepID=UPI00057FF6A6|nr:DNA translocase FtsK 4TM domain-containing protein [Flavihumibacter sp. ZG627]KIC89319.1 cell division protein FtsK [Flavihumibacter sp. ZG627]
MANKLKSKKKPLPDTVDLRQDKEEKVEMKSLVKDERTLKITGAILLLLAIFLFIAFTSYLFTWQEDQDKVFKGGSEFLFADNIRVSNLLGRLGAWVSHFFFYKGFGIASYFLCSLFFVSGANLLFERKIFRLTRNMRYVLVGLIYFSVALAFFFGASAFPWGGAVGAMVSDWMTKFLGTIGTAAILLAAGVAYFIWRFNPVFSVPKIPANPLRKNNDPAPDLTGNKEEVNEPRLFIEEKLAKKNGLKKNDGGIVVIPPPDPITSIPLEVIEKESNDFELQDQVEEDETIPVPEQEPKIEEDVHAYVEMPSPPIRPQVPQVAQVPVSDLELEIKAIPEGTIEEEINEKIPELPPYEPTLDLRDYKYPGMDLLETHGSEKIVQDPAELETNKNQIITTLKNYDIHIQKISATVGPTVTLYEIVPAAGVRISRIKNLEDDIALSLAALGIRIIAPIPGKGTIGIEVPNVKKTVVSMKTLLNSDKFQNANFSLPIAIGKKIDNENFIVDLAAMPHLLMAGATGQGKSVGLNAILVSLLYKKHPSQLKFVLVDPKKVELSLYRTIERHFLAKLPGEEEAIITDTKKVINTLNALCIEMDNRYDLLKEAGTRNIKEYNEKFVKRKLNPQKGHQFLPFIVLVIDEFADLIMTAGKEVEMPIARLAQLARAVGIHLIIATQRPSVNIITGTIKANFPARIAFKVSSKIDSRTILDAGGAEQLIGKGDMLISYNGELTRLQCAFVDTPEVEGVTEFIGDQRGYPQAFLLPEYVDEKDLEGKDFDLGDKDPLFEEAARLIVSNQVGSTSLLQRRMKLGYNRAGRLMDQLEAAGVVGPNLGSKAREVIIKTESELDQFLSERL